MCAFFQRLDYQWYQTACLQCDCFVNAISWNLEGTRLLAGGSCIQLWLSPDEGFTPVDAPSEAGGVGFTLEPDEPVEPEWATVWKCYTASPIYHLKFSPDGLLFASAGKVLFNHCFI